MYSREALTDGASFLAIMGLGTPLAILLPYPLVAGMVRLVVNHAPRESTNPIPTLWATLRRTLRLEGVAGLFRGSLLCMALGLAYALPSSLAMAQWAAQTRDGLHDSPLNPRHCFLATVAVAVGTIPLSVLHVRKIVTAPSRPTRSLLTARERAEPWRLWKPSLVANTLLSFGVALSWDEFIVPFSAESPALFLALRAVFAIVTQPLTVLEARLAVEGLSRSSDANDTEKGKATDTVDGPNAAAGMVAVRPAPYGSLWGAVTTIVREEGPGALFRGWAASALQAMVLGVAGVRRG